MYFTDMSCMIKDLLNTLIYQIGSAGIKLMFTMITLYLLVVLHQVFFSSRELLG